MAWCASMGAGRSCSTFACAHLQACSTAGAVQVLEGHIRVRMFGVGRIVEGIVKESLQNVSPPWGTQRRWFWTARNWLVWVNCAEAEQQADMRLRDCASCRCRPTRSCRRLCGGGSCSARRRCRRAMGGSCCWAVRPWGAKWGGSGRRSCRSSRCGAVWQAAAADAAVGCCRPARLVCCCAASKG